MYKKPLLILLITFSCLELIAQDSLRATTEVRYRVAAIIDTVTHKLATDTCCLRLNAAHSLFYNQDDFMIDLLRHHDITKWSELMSNSLGKRIRKGDGNFTYYVLKDFQHGTYTFEDRISTDKFRYTDSIPDFKWVIMTDFKNVAGRKCRKATCTYMGRTYEAWFEPNTNLHDGPWKFCNLPGLILEVYDTKHEYTFTYIDAHSVNGEISLPSSKHFNVDKTIFFKQQAKFYEDPVAYTKENATIRISFGNSQNGFTKGIRNNNRHQPLEITAQ